MRRTSALILIAVVALIIASIVLAQGGELKLPWSRIAGGGGASEDGARYALSGTIGQADAGALSDGKRFTLNGGYWRAIDRDSAGQEVFLPLVNRMD